MESAATLATIESIRSLITQAIAQATNRADYLTFKAATELKGVLDSWENANSKLLNQAFQSLDEQQQRFFRDADKLATRLNDSATNQLETARQVAELANQTVSDVKFWDGKAAVFRTTPAVVHPAIPNEVILTVRGVSLDEANPRLRIAGRDVEFNRVGLLRQQAQFVIPKSALTFSDSAKRLQLELVYSNPKDGIWNRIRSAREEVVAPLPILLLPNRLGKAEIFTTNTESTRLSQMKEREFHFSHSGNSEQCDIQQQQPSMDFLINVDSIAPYERPNPRAGETIRLLGARIVLPPTLPSEWGRGGNWRIESKAPHGFAVRICAKRWYGPGLDSGPGFKHVYMRWEEFKIVSNDVAGAAPFASRQLSWTSDEAVTLPANTKAIRVRVELFNGATKEATYSRLEEFFEIDYNSATKQLVLRPRVPPELTTL